ncbi:hypothetical protein [Pinibacter soli]|uniref:GH141-like insertion domain-containing protein n=1 Tax=Pinibacter soli TaxID=3044211 RepID=A0ABT6RBB7_9BACT|nr:hypothetical protein [Pinibacter soli]MDI3319825.1 hypothetical protein [Pinibacter soli]
MILRINRSTDKSSNYKTTFSHLRKLCFIVLLVVLTGLVAMAGKPINYYVDPVKGNDITYDGTSAAKAFRTIEKARDVVRTMHANMKGDIHVYLRGGTYWLKSTLLFDTTDSGTGGFNIIYAAYKNEKPVISGGKEITGWNLYDTTKNIYRAYTGKGLETRQLFVNGVRATRARSTVAPSPLTFVKAFGYTAKADVFANSSIPMQQWKNQSDIEFVFKNEWTAPRIGVGTITRNDSITTISMKQPGWGFVTNKGGTSVGGNHNAKGLPWFIENAYELLDEEGEWYLDRTTGFIYYKPRTGENLAAASVVVPVLEELVRIQGADAGNKVSNIQFRGLTFSHATYLRVNGNRGLPDAQNNVIRDDQGESIINAAVNLTYARAIKFERVVFEHLGGNALNMYSGSQDNLVVGCVFTDISGNGIQIGDYKGMFTAGTENYILNADSLVWLRNNDVYNSYFNKIGVEYFSSTAIAATLPVDMDIVHNEIGNIPYSGIHIGWGWDRFATSVSQRTNIQYNYIHDVMSVLRDGGAIYTLGPTNGSATNKGRISNNYIQNVNNQFGALYADEGSSWFDLTDNVINNTPRYAHIWISTIHDININNNYTTTLNNVNKGINTSMTNATLVSNGNWPSAAQKIMNNAGLEKDYLNIKPASGK